MQFSLLKLDNQLDVVLAPLKNSTAVTVFFLVKAGSKYETKDQNGISHFLEHMFFKGTQKRPSAFLLSEALDKVGGEYNAFTGKEYTGFYVKVAPSHLVLALDVLSDMLTNSLFKEEEAQRERRVILEEIKLYHDTPTAYIDDIFERLLYGDTPAGREIIGTPETLNSIKASDIKQYFLSHYSSLNSLVAVAGALPSPEKTLKLVNKFFATFPSQKAPVISPLKERQAKANYSVSYKKTDQTHLCLGVRTFSFFDKRKYALMLLDAVLGGGMSSRFFTKIREREGLAYYVKTNSQAYSDSGYFAVQAGIPHKKIKKVVSLITEEFQELKRSTLPHKELHKAKEYLKGTTLLGLETSDQIAAFLGRQWLLKKHINTPKELFDKIDKISTQDIQALAQQIFVPQKLNLALIGPHSKGQIKEILQKINF